MPIEMRVHFDKYQPRDHQIEVPTTSGCPTVLGSAKKSQWPARWGAAQRGGRGGKSDGRAVGPTGRGPGRFGEAAGIEGDARHAKKHERAQVWTFSPPTASRDFASAVRSKSRLVTGKEQVATCGAVQSRDLHALKKQTF